VAELAGGSPCSPRCRMEAGRPWPSWRRDGTIASRYRGSSRGRSTAKAATSPSIAHSFRPCARPHRRGAQPKQTK